ncbi:N-acetylmuramoyl-L-alanine amidase family protein [Shouchella patagoniensis]|uniref:N-acetylmuramoyl-L-alanine amidase family protein n=1 Tax=Shouchella patagoniensis TaxID=228576 RepID=UPI000995CC27|nr:N-acetylmuramoyl-L-alanine amidase [Shouchella patagoniensis]
MYIKKRVAICGIALIATLSSWSLSNSIAKADVSGKTIVIDPGHGGNDPGAVANGLEEKEVVLDVAVQTKQMLEAAGAEVLMSRQADTYIGLNERAQMANANQADTFVSIHANAWEQPSANGTETYHFPSSVQGRALAESLQNELVVELGRTDRGVKSANFNVLKQTVMPAALVELAFVTNVEEAELMKTAAFREQAAEAIYQGLMSYH